MEKYVIQGGKPLYGTIDVSGMKNAALAILMATVLVDDTCVIENLPSIIDVSVALEILESLGVQVRRIRRDAVEINASHASCGVSPQELVQKMRASYYLLGAELGRFGHSYVAYPGGCDFGVRPIDQHIKGFEALGASVKVENGYVDISTESHGLRGGDVYFDVVTVGGTINVMLAAVRAKGTTVIENAAREPHVVDTANFLNACGARISGAGTDTIKIRGVDHMHGCNYAIIPDMIEAGTYMILAAATGGTVRINNIIPKHLESISAKLTEMGVTVGEYDDYFIITRQGALTRATVKTMPYPGYPTDLQPQMCVLMCLAKGVSYLNESVWDNRFRYVNELRRMGAVIRVNERTAIIEGPARLTGTVVRAVDLRAGAAMVIAGLAVSGRTEIRNICYIERGYDDVVGKLQSIGADIVRVEDPDPALYDKAN